VAKNLILVDTNILIDVFRGNKESKKQLDALEGRIAVSVITVMELFRGCKTNKRKAELTEQLKAYEIIHIDTIVSEKALQLFSHYISTHQDMYIADCLIAATNIIHKTKLFTNNKSDFNFIKSVEFFHPK
jgi:predicted nucleic acid-binding protein